MNNKEKHEFALRVVRTTLGLRGYFVDDENSADSDLKHNIITNCYRHGTKHIVPVGSILPAVVLFKESPQEVGGTRAHGWDAPRLLQMMEDAKARSTDYIIFIVDYKNGCVYSQKLTELSKPIKIGIDFPHVQTAQGTPVKIYYPLQAFDIFSGIPNEFMEEYSKSLNDKRADMFTNKPNPLLDAISGATALGLCVCVEDALVGGKKGVSLRISATGRKLSGTRIINQPYTVGDDGIIAGINEAIIEAAEHYVYLLLPKGELKELRSMFAEPMLTEKIKQRNFPTVFKRAEACIHAGDVLVARVITRSPLKYTALQGFNA